MAKEKVSLFDVIPFVSGHITTIKEGDLSVVTFPRFPNAFLQKVFARYAKSDRIYIRLDRYGTAVWDAIDGKRSVKEMCKALEETFSGEEDYEARILSFISQLQAKGFINYKIAK